MATPLDPRSRLYRSDATLWVWICYGLAQATVTMLMAFDVLSSLTAAEVVTAVSLIAYVAVNELVVRPGRRRHRPVAASESPPDGPDGPASIDPPVPPI